MSAQFIWEVKGPQWQKRVLQLKSTDYPWWRFHHLDEVRLTSGRRQKICFVFLKKLSWLSWTIPVTEEISCPAMEISSSKEQRVKVALEAKWRLSYCVSRPRWQKHLHGCLLSGRCLFPHLQPGPEYTWPPKRATDERGYFLWLIMESDGWTTSKFFLSRRKGIWRSILKNSG